MRICIYTYITTYFTEKLRISDGFFVFLFFALRADLICLVHLNYSIPAIYGISQSFLQSYFITLNSKIEFIIMSTTKTEIAPPSVIKGSYEKLLRKMYISNVAKRLRQLNQPSDVDRKRWVWELIQNAKDSIVGDPTRNQMK